MYKIHKLSADLWFFIGRVCPFVFDQCEKNAERHIMKMAQITLFGRD